MKQNCWAITTSNNQTDDSVFLSWWLGNTWNLKSKFKFQVFSSRQDRKKKLVHLSFGRNYGSPILFQDLLTFIYNSWWIPLLSDKNSSRIDFRRHFCCWEKQMSAKFFFEEFQSNYIFSYLFISHEQSPKILMLLISSPVIPLFELYSVRTKSPLWYLSGYSLSPHLI